nr:DinB family protein [Actinomycetales bacterium]
MSDLTPGSDRPPQPTPPRSTPLQPTPPDRTAPDTKDWTWIRSRRCDECGFDPGEITRGALPELMRSTGERFAAVLLQPGSADRPEPSVWSPIEYGRHTADVCHVMTGRLRLILESGGEATFENWDGEAAAVTNEYWRAGAEDAANLVRQRSSSAAQAWSRVDSGQWDLVGVRGDGVRFTVWGLGLYLAHELVHHLYDVER